ncbi:MAG: hypothetical protein PHH11_06665 [Methylomonas sp.]|nr:hypothetical protein [Methylomonas sp.]
MPKIFVYGDSHTRVLKDAAERFPKGNKIEFDIHWMFSEKNGVTRGDMMFEDAKTAVASLQSGDIFVISLLGTAHNIFGLVEHERKFCVVSEQCSNNTFLDCELIPSSTMRDMFYGVCQKNKRIGELKSQATVPVYHLMTPPPKEDNEYIKAKTSRYRDKIIGEHDINKPELRLALWNLEMSAVKQFCEGLDVNVIEPPFESISEHGFLKPHFYGGDATHANRAYGELVLYQLKELTILPQKKAGSLL